MSRPVRGAAHFGTGHLDCDLRSIDMAARVRSLASYWTVAVVLTLIGTQSAAVDGQGRSNPVSANVLSEHELEVLDSMSPQAQAELLLERSINHFRGANEQIVLARRPFAPG